MQNRNAPRPKNHLFGFGFGYSARALAARLAGTTWRIQGTTRKATTAGEKTGIPLLPFDGDAPLANANHHLADVTHLLLSVPPDANGDPVLRHHEKILGAIPRLRWIGYLSTTGVYGDHGGGWVDEETPLQPTTPRSEWRANAETAWLAFGTAHGLPVHIFRLAGIYGPGRNALETLREGRARRVCKPGQVFSRIHVADLAETLRRSMDAPRAGRIYNVCDDRPAPPQDVIAFAATLLGVTPPPEIAFEDANLSEMARSFYADNKRVENTRIKRELGVTLRYPDYEAGLTALFATLPTG